MHGRALLVPDVSKDMRYVTIRENVRSEMAAPLDDDQQVHGVVNLDSDEANAFSDSDLEALQLLAREATLVIKRLWKLNHLQRWNQGFEQ